MEREPEHEMNSTYGVVGFETVLLTRRAIMDCGESAWLAGCMLLKRDET